MIKLENLVNSFSKTNLSIDRLCDIKTYLPIKEKFDFVKEYYDILAERIYDYPGLEAVVAYVFFNMLVIKKYTNIEFELNYDNFDILQKNELMKTIIEFIGEDYDIIKQFIKSK